MLFNWVTYSIKKLGTLNTIWVGAEPQQGPEERAGLQLAERKLMPISWEAAPAVSSDNRGGVTSPIHAHVQAKLGWAKDGGAPDQSKVGHIKESSVRGQAAGRGGGQAEGQEWGKKTEGRGQKEGAGQWDGKQERQGERAYGKDELEQGKEEEKESEAVALGLWEACPSEELNYSGKGRDE